MLVRARFAAFVLALAACKASPATTAPPQSTQHAQPPPAALVTAPDGSKCTPPATVDAAAARDACTARGPDCSYTQELTCRGVDVGAEVREQERRAAEAGDVPCACVCSADLEACAQVP